MSKGGRLVAPAVESGYATKAEVRLTIDSLKTGATTAGKATQLATARTIAIGGTATATVGTVSGTATSFNGYNQLLL